MITELLEKVSDITMSTAEVTKDILVLNFTVVNVAIVSNLNNNFIEWVLIDTGLENSWKDIIKTTEERFGKDAKPKAIILTHGHFDHVGSVIELSKRWNVPVYAHDLELPYLTGQRDYPSGDPTVDGGLVAELSPAFPHHSINLGNHVKTLPSDGSIPDMPGWRWIHTPGHTPGHISLFRDKDRILIVGDAFTTVKQESLASVLTQETNVSGPPAYLTTDWESAEKSVKELTALKPSLIIPSHGQSMSGSDISYYLENLSKHFESIAVPKHGRFIE